MRQGYSLSTLTHLLNIVLVFTARAIRQEEEIKGTQIGKEDVKISLFTEHMILCLQDPENSTKKLLDTVNRFKQSSRIKNQFTKISSLSIQQ
jgi:hypothetical protein